MIVCHGMDESLEKFRLQIKSKELQLEKEAC
jgi:hypothetical protein